MTNRIKKLLKFTFANDKDAIKLGLNQRFFYNQDKNLHFYDSSQTKTNSIWEKS